MKKPKLSGKERMSGPFEPTAYKVERSAVAVLMHWMRGIIEQKALDLGPPDVDTYGPDGKSPDLVIYESRRSQNVLCVIEAKPPHFDVFDYENLKEPARAKATRRGAKYFATTNFRQLIWFNTEKVNAQTPEEEQVVDKYHLSELENLGRIEETRHKESITRELEAFLVKLYAVHTGKEPEPKQTIDEFLIYRLYSKINTLSRYYTTIIDNRCHKDNSFAAELGKWFVSQGWSFVWQRQDFDKAARQTAYLLVNKILFYNVLQAKRPHQLAPLEIPQGLFRGAQVQKILQSFFDELLKIDYETIYTTDFIDAIAFPDEKEVVKEIKELVNILRQYDFSRLGDVIGPIFERLIPQDERHNLGQYFTNDDVVDIILKFCLKHEDDKLLDPACGAGTFLVSAYRHKKLLNQRLGHEDILKTLWGNDIAKFPAHLATINLAIRDLGVDKNYPNILQEDFFTLLSTEGGFELPARSRQAMATRLDTKEEEITYPRWFDCIVGNPPYTRQEEMREIAPQIKEYKEKIIAGALKNNTGRKIAEISKRAGIHVYFFIHGMKFLRDGGRFGFIVSNSWLDVDYGKGLQEFFLNNYKIIAIVESKVERWFEEADINTCIVILERCRDKKERDLNLVRFVYLLQPLRHFIPPAQDMWQQQVERLNEIDKLIKTILAHTEFYQNEEVRIFAKSQVELWEEGFDKEEGKYVGAKWGKYIRAPEIFFKILEKGKGKLVPLKEIAEVRFGIKTGANEFFYLTEEEINRRGIEREFWMHQDEKGNWVPNYVIRSLRECPTLTARAENLRLRMLMVHTEKANLKGNNVLRFIQNGESKGFDKRPTCNTRKHWYEIEDRVPFPILFSQMMGDRYMVIHNPTLAYVDHNFHEIRPKNTFYCERLVAVLNCTASSLFRELDSYLFTGSINITKMDTWSVERFLTIDISKVSKDCAVKLRRAVRNLSARSVEHSLKELGASSPDEVSLDRVKPDRRELDKIVMGEILGLSDEEQIEVYRAVVDLVKSRIEKANSFGKRRKTKEGIDIDRLVKTVMETLGEDTLGKFYREKVLSHKSLVKQALPSASGEVRLEQDLFGWRLSWGRQHLACTSEPEARYLRVWAQAGMESVKVPGDEDYLKAIIPELETLKQKTDEVFENYLVSILDSRTRQRLLHQLWQEVMK